MDGLVFRCFRNGAPLNESHQACWVHLLEYWEVHPARIVNKVRREGMLLVFLADQTE